MVANASTAPKTSQQVELAPIGANVLIGDFGRLAVQAKGAESTLTSPAKYVVDAAPQVSTSFENEFNAATTDTQRRFLSLLRAFCESGARVPFRNDRPCLKSLLLLLSVQPAEVYGDSGILDIVARMAPVLAPMQCTAVKLQIDEFRKGTIIQVVRDKLDALPYGTAIPSHGKYASNAGLALDVLHLPRDMVFGNPQIKAEVRARLVSGQLVLGTPWRSGITLAKRAEARSAVISVLDGYADDQNHALPGDAMRRTKVEFGSILDQAGIFDPNLREAMTVDPGVRKAKTVTIAKIGVRPTGEVFPEERFVSYAELARDGLEMAKENYRNKHPDAEADGSSETAFIRNERSALNRFMRVNSIDDTAPIATGLCGLESDALIENGCSAVQSDRAYRLAMKRWRVSALALLGAVEGPKGFAEVLAAAMRAAGLSVAELARRSNGASGSGPACAINAGVLRRWRSGVGVPTFNQLHIVRRIAKELGLTESTLTRELDTRYVGKNTTKRQTVTLSDGRTMKLTRYLRFLPDGAIVWDDAKLLAAVEEVELRMYGNNSAFRARQNATSTNAYKLPPIDKSWPMLVEFEALRVFKTTVFNTENVSSSKWMWNSELTVVGARQLVEKFAQWCVLSRTLGGLGLAHQFVSLSLCLNHRLVIGYIIWRMTRAQDLEVDGEPIGPMLTATEHRIAGFFKALVEPTYGWLTQSRDVVAPLVRIPETFMLKTVSLVDHEWIIGEPTAIEIMDQATVDMSETDWIKCCIRSRQYFGQFDGMIGAKYKASRNSRLRVMPILRHEFPIAVVVRQVTMALARCHPIDQCPKRHAKDFRNAAIMLLLMTVVFRSGTLRGMTYRADGTGNLRRTPTGYDVHVDRNEFKNGYCEWLFGPTFQQRDYERELGHWGSFNAVMDHYINICRPILLEGRDSDLLFPTAKAGTKKWTHKTFNAVITNWTREFSCTNLRLGTGMAGVSAWGPHGARDIVATHIIRVYEGDNRWELAAMILATGVSQVKLRYAWVDSKREFAKVNSIMSDAFSRGEGSEYLF